MDDRPQTSAITLTQLSLNDLLFLTNHRDCGDTFPTNNLNKNWTHSVLQRNFTLLACA